MPKKKNKKKKAKNTKIVKVELSPEEEAQKIIKKEEGDLELDPRRQKMSSFYYDVNSTTHGNAYQSAIRAGFSKSYAEHILFTKPRWLSEIVRKMGILDKLEKNYEEALNRDIIVQASGPFGPLFQTITTGKGKNKKKKKIPIMVESNTRIKMRNEVTMFGLERMHPDFKKKEKTDFDTPKVEIKQIFIIDPNGNNRIPYNQTGAETIPGLPKVA